jgi:hypothetical protein
MPLRVGLGFSLVALTALFLAAPARPDDSSGPKTVERGMVDIARKLVRELQKRGYANVGVLKFLVSTDGKGPRDSVGTLNMLLARQLELALILKNEPKNPIGVIKNASAVAHRTNGANHRTKAGIAKLFSAKYPLAWGNNEVSADAFVTGLAIIRKDLTAMTVQLMVVDGKENRLRSLGSDYVLTAKMDPGKLSEAGESFVLRGAFDDGGAETTAAGQKKTEAAVIKAAVKAREEKKENPYFAPANEKPVSLVVLYNGKPAPITFKDGKAQIPTPKVGTEIKFRLTRDGSQETYGVVLKLNGENTVGKQKLPDLECRKWILVSGKSATISGYQLDNHTFQPFKVLTRAESAKLAMNYGDDAGTISLTVFKARKGEAPVGDPLDKDASKEAIVKKAKLPDDYADNPAALVAKMEEEASRGLDDGGLIGGAGEVKKGGVKTVKFQPDPTPVMSLTLVYYSKP